MIYVVWEYIVRESARRRFMRLYGPGGAWAQLLQGTPGFAGTVLLHDTEEPRRFLTIDTWDTTRRRTPPRVVAGRLSMDALLEDLTEDQDEIGTFTSFGDVSGSLPFSRARRASRRAKRDAAEQRLAPDGRRGARGRRAARR